MIKLLFSLVCLLITSFAFAQDQTQNSPAYPPQYAYQDAKEIICIVPTPVPNQDKKIVLNWKSPVCMQILMRYFTNNLDTKDNPFLLIENFPDKQPQIVDIAQKQIEAKQISGASGISVPMITLAFVDFLAKRVKEELSVAFFEAFAKEIEANAILRDLLPSTADTLKAMSEKIYQFSSYIELLREAMQSDIKSIWNRLPFLFDNSEVKSYITGLRISDDNYNKLSKVLSFAMSIANGISTQKHAGVIFEELKIDDLNSVWTNKNIFNLIQLAQIISVSLKENPTISNDKYYWIPKDTFSFLFQIEDGELKNIAKIYLGLLYQQLENNNIIFDFKNEMINVADQLKSPKSKKLHEILQAFMVVVDDLENIHGRIIANNSKEVPPADYFDYAESYIRIFENGMNLFFNHFSHINNPNTKNEWTELRNQSQNFINIARALKNVFIGVRQRDYSLAMFNVTIAWNSITNILPSIDKSKIKDQIFRVLSKYGAFIAAVAKAKNSEELVNAIESVALPTGSYSIKRNSPFNVSLNAYPGIAGEEENYIEFDKIQNSTSSQTNDWGLVSVCAPVGLAVSWGEPESGSFSLFFSFIDPGALLAYRFTNIQENDIPEFSLKNIISPGVFMVWGFKKIPLSLGFGAKLGPELRKIEYDSVTNTIASDMRSRSFRVGLFIAVDIPLLNFYTK